MRNSNLIFNKKLSISYTLLLLGILSMRAQSFSVFNAGSSPGANGIYIEDGTFNAVPKYTNGEYVLFYANQNMKWAIVSEGTNLSLDDFTNSPFLYSSPTDLNTPPQPGWHQGGNTTGLPGEYIVVAPENSLGCTKECFVESLADNGTIKDTAIFYLYAKGISLCGSNGDDFISDGKVDIINTPAGFTSRAIRTSDTPLNIFFEGTAVAHTMKDNTDSLVLIVKNSVLSNTDASVLLKTLLNLV